MSLPALPFLRPVAGLDLTADSARAVLLSPYAGNVTGQADVPFDAVNPDACVAALRQRLGDVSAISIAVGYAHLHMNAVRLPPVSPAEQVAILALEPDRFFPVSTAVAVSMSGGDLACATDADVLQRWIDAFATWARVVAVTAAPNAAAMALADVRDITGVIEVPAELSPGETAVIEMRDGVLAGARRVPAGMPVDASPMPSAHGVTAAFMVAYGAAKSAAAPLHHQLLPVSFRARLAGARARRSALAAAALVAAFAFCLWAFDHARARELERVQRDVAQLADSSAPALALQARIATLARETEASDGGARSSPLRVLAALGERLPHDATVVAIAEDGDVWHLDGRAQNAAAIVPALDADPRFSDVHLSGPTTRFTDNGRTFESFSIAFRAGAAR